MHPGLEEILAFLDIVRPQGVEVDPAAVVVQHRARPGRRLARFLKGFQAGEQVHAVHIEGVFYGDGHFGVISLAHAPEDVAAAQLDRDEALSRYVGGCAET